MRLLSLPGKPRLATGSSVVLGADASSTSSLPRLSITLSSQQLASLIIVLLVVLWRLRYKLSLRDLAEMFLVRGFEFTHEAVRDWEVRFAPLITEQLRSRRRGKAGHSWYLDETYVKVGGKWHYLYRAINRDGNLVDSMLSEKRDMAAAKKFFTGAKEVVGHKPVRVTTDGHDSYPRAIRRILGRKVIHRTNRYLNMRALIPDTSIRWCRCRETHRLFL